MSIVGLLILAILCFLLAAFGVTIGHVSLLAIGLALLAGALIFGSPWVRGRF